MRQIHYISSLVVAYGIALHVYCARYDTSTAEIITLTHLIIIIYNF